MEEQQRKQDFNNVGTTVITQDALPLSCPLPNMAIWNAHPRVYLPIEETGEATCPYCGAHYRLEDYERGHFE